jgi:hypothetical protein
MSSPNTQTSGRSDNPAEQPKRAQLSAVQVAASALAAVSSAVVASFFGMAGTLIGAALASVIATVSTTVYTESLRRTNDGLKRVLIARPAAASAQESAQEPPAPRTLPTHLDPRRAPAKLRGPRWSRVAVYAVAVFVVAMGIVTGIEVIGQKPVSALVGNSHSSGTTTIGELTNASSHRDTTPSAPSSPTTTAPATTTVGSSPSKATATGDSGSRSSSSSTTSSSESASSAPRASATPTPAAGTSSAPARDTAPTP